MILNCKNISKSFGVTEILKNISFSISKNEKVGLIGVNGAGKSTLFKIITNEISPDDGEIILNSNIKLGYMSQVLQLDNNSTIYSELLSVFKDVIQIEKNIQKLSQEITTLKDKELEQAMKKYSNLTNLFEQKNGYEYESRIKGIVKGLGFSENDLDTPIKTLSGGQKTRISLSKLLLINPDLLLLDEPTNHLDIDSITWLEDFLKNYNGSIIIISHDRYFLDKITTKTIELENKKIKIYNGNYSYYIRKKEEIREIELKQYLEQQKQIKKQEESIKTLKSFNREKSIKRAESKEKQLEKMQVMEKPENLPEKMRLSFHINKTSGNDVLKVDNLEKKLENNILFSDVNFEIKRGETVALIGPNGIGKTTLLKMILNNNNPNIKIGKNVDIGYYDQEHNNLNNNKTIFDEIHDAYPTLTITEIRNTLASFVFTEDDVFKKIEDLSGGEKGRVALCKIILSNSNLLILDEPTNHLDLFSKEILEDAIRRFEGTILYISHDRYFINNTANRVIELSKNGITNYMGNYDYYIEKKVPVIETVEKLSNDESDNKKSWQSKKEQEAESRKIKNRIRKIEQEMDKLEKEIAKLDEELLKDDVASDYEKAATFYDKKATAENKLFNLLEELEKINS